MLSGNNVDMYKWTILKMTQSLSTALPRHQKEEWWAKSTKQTPHIKPYKEKLQQRSRLGTLERSVGKLLEAKAI